MELSNDKVSNVRRECAVASLTIRPYFEQDVDLQLEIMEMMHKLAQDSDHDVVEAAEQAEFLGLQKENKLVDPKAEDAKR